MKKKKGNFSAPREFFMITKNFQNLPNYNFYFKLFSIEAIGEVVERLKVKDQNLQKNGELKSNLKVYFEYHGRKITPNGFSIMNENLENLSNQIFCFKQFSIEAIGRIVERFVARDWNH